MIPPWLIEPSIELETKNLSSIESTGRPAVVSEMQRPELAISLGVLATRLCQVGRSLEAIPLARRSVDEWTTLSELDEGHRSGLAIALDILASALSDAGMRTDAFQTSLEAVNVYSDISALTVGTLSDLAGVLLNHANRLVSMGRHDDARVDCEESVRLFELVAAELPIKQRDLAFALSRWSEILGQTMAPVSSEKAAERSVDIYRQLSPVDRSVDKDLALSLCVYASSLRSNSRADKAIGIAREAVELSRSLIDFAVGDTSRVLVQCLAEYSICLSGEGCHSAAVEATDEALTHFDHIDRLLQVSLLRVRCESLVADPDNDDSWQLADETLSALISMVSSDDDGPLLVASIHLQSAVVRYQLGRHLDALADADRSILEYDSIEASSGGAHTMIGEALFIRSEILVALGDIGGAAHGMVEASQAWRGVDDLSSVTDLAFLLGRIHDLVPSLVEAGLDEAVEALEVEWSEWMILLQDAWKGEDSTSIPEH